MEITRDRLCRLNFTPLHSLFNHIHGSGSVLLTSWWPDQNTHVISSLFLSSTIIRQQIAALLFMSFINLIREQNMLFQFGFWGIGKTGMWKWASAWAYLTAAGNKKNHTIPKCVWLFWPLFWLLLFVSLSCCPPVSHFVFIGQLSGDFILFDRIRQTKYLSQIIMSK